MGILNSEEDRLRKRLASVEDELDQFRNGNRGACCSCEYVGEKIRELEVAVLREKRRVDSLHQYIGRVEDQRGVLLEALHEIDAMKDDWGMLYANQVKPITKAAIAKVQGGEE